MISCGNKSCRAEFWLFLVPACLVLFLVAVFAFYQYWHDAITSTIACLGMLIVFIGLLPMIIAGKLGNPHSVPWFQGIGLFYSFFFGVPIFTKPLVQNEDGTITIFSRVILDKVETGPLVIVAAGIGLMILCYYFHYTFEQSL